MNYARHANLDGHDAEPLVRPKVPPADSMPLHGKRLALFSGNYNYVRDGANQALNRLVRHLEEAKGMQVRVYSPTSPTPAFEPAGTLVSVPSFTIPWRREYRLSRGLSPAIKQDVADFAPDLVHVSAPDRLGWQMLRFAAEDLRVPVIASLHTMFAKYFSFYGLSFLQGPAERYLDRFYGRCDRILVPTLPLLEEFTSRYGADKVRLWQRGVDRSQFHPRRRDNQWRRSIGIEDGEIAPLFFGRIVLEKGVEQFAQIIRALRQRGKRPRPIIVGDGPALARLRKLLPEAHCTGQLTGETLAHAVASADFMINPSLTEAFGNVVLEAMACGLPVISADTPSARNIVSNGEDGLLCSTPDCASLTDMAERLMNDPLLRERLGKQAALTACNYDWVAELDRACLVYGEMLAMAHGRKTDNRTPEHPRKAG